MRVRIALLLVAIILGVVAVIGVIAYIASIRASVEEEVEKVEVLVAVQNIPRETSVEQILSVGSVALEGIPRKYLADGVLTSLDRYKGYVVAVPINKGEQITTTKFIKPEDIGLAFIVPDDMVAISIPINEVKGVSNLINTGDRVNVIATFTIPDEETITVPREIGEEEEEAFLTEEVIIQNEVTKTILWNVEVLYIGTRVRAAGVVEEETETFIEGRTEREVREAQITTVTLVVTPEDSEKLVFSEEMGSVWLALLPIEGIERKETPGRTYDSIFD